MARQNPNPRKYRTNAERQKAWRDRWYAYTAVCSLDGCDGDPAPVLRRVFEKGRELGYSAEATFNEIRNHAHGMFDEEFFKTVEAVAREYGFDVTQEKI